MGQPLTFDELGTLLEWHKRGGRVQHFAPVPPGTLSPLARAGLRARARRSASKAHDQALRDIGR